MISLQKLKILTPLQKFPKNTRDLGKLIAPKGFEKLPKVKKSPNLVTLGPQTLTRSGTFVLWNEKSFNRCGLKKGFDIGKVKERLMQKRKRS